MRSRSREAELLGLICVWLLVRDMEGFVDSFLGVMACCVIFQSQILRLATILYFLNRLLFTFSIPRLKVLVCTLIPPLSTTSYLPSGDISNGKPLL